MKVSELKKVDVGTKGLSIKGELRSVWAPKKTPYGPTQFMLIADDTDTVGVQAKESDFTEADKGATVEIKGATWRSYEVGGVTKYVLEVPKSKSSSINLVGPPASGGNLTNLVSTLPKVDEGQLEDLKESVLKDYKESLIRSMELLGDDVISGMLKVCREKGWETKDVTAVAASLYIEINKMKHMAQMRR